MWVKIKVDPFDLRLEMLKEGHTNLEFVSLLVVRFGLVLILIYAFVLLLLLYK